MPRDLIFEGFLEPFWSSILNVFSRFPIFGKANQMRSTIRNLKKKLDQNRQGVYIKKLAGPDPGRELCKTAQGAAIKKLAAHGQALPKDSLRIP